MKWKMHMPLAFYGLLLVTMMLVACNDRNNETDRNNGEKTNVTDTRRNTTDTSNYISDSAGKSVQ